MQKDKEKSCQQASTITFVDANYGDSKNELQIMIAKRPQIEKVPQTFTGATFSDFYWRRARRRGIEKAIASKSGSKPTFLRALCLESFFKNMLPADGGEHIFEKNTRTVAKSRPKI